ncbi:HTH_Tnp_Tc3_1 domain-containing protein [Trichonephila clavipes]|nr:HTH_Tnp_Tc3_1 domain-containing protein [Trichonephila clavipes]
MRMQINRYGINQSMVLLSAKFYIRQRVFGTVVRQVTAAAMPYYKTLSEFERGVIFTARDMGHSISKVAMKFGFSRTRPFQECTLTSEIR